MNGRRLCERQIPAPHGVLLVSKDSLSDFQNGINNATNRLHQTVWNTALQ